MCGRYPPRHHITSNHLLYHVEVHVLFLHKRLFCVIFSVCATNVYLRTRAMVLYVIGHEYHMHTHMLSTRRSMEGPHHRR